MRERDVSICNCGNIKLKRASSCKQCYFIKIHTQNLTKQVCPGCGGRKKEEYRVCRSCANKEKVKWTIKDFVEHANKLEGSCLSKEYKWGVRLEWQCKEGHVWKTTWGHIRRGGWCNKCFAINHRKYSIKDCQAVAIKNEGLCLSKEFIQINKKLKWECKKGHQWEAKFGHVKKGSWCPYCFGNVVLTIEECRNLAKERNGECLSTQYINMQTKMLWKCNVCEHEWKARFNGIKTHKTWCPMCGITTYKSSEAEIEIYEYVKEIYPDALNNKPGIIKSKQMKIDIYVPSLRKAIEYDGERFHKGEWAERVGNVERDKRKNKECEELGIRLLRVSDKYYLKNKEKVKKEILEFLKDG